MKPVLAAAMILVLGVPAFAQYGAINGPGTASSVGKQNAPKEQADDPIKKKQDERAFRDGVSRIPDPEKKYDPWGNLRSGGK
jgi:hypothetical protein